MTPAKIFQQQFGAKWAAIAQGAELTNALLAVNAPLLDEITNLSPIEIRENGCVILAKLQGQLLHERALIDLSIVHPDPLGDAPESTYPDPREELEEELGSKKEELGSGGAAFAEWQTLAAANAEAPVLPEKKRGRPKGSKNKPK